jgi:hypothetical protein
MFFIATEFNALKLDIEMCFFMTRRNDLFCDILMTNVCGAHKIVNVFTACVQNIGTNIGAILILKIL